MSPPRRLTLAVLAPGLLAAAAAFVCLGAAGPTAGLFFGGVAFAATIVPPFAGARRGRRASVTPAVSFVVGSVGIWLLALPDDYVAFRHWLTATLVLASCAAALTGLTLLLRATRLPAPLPAALTTVTFLLWLTWPIWLSPHLAGRERLVAALTVAHPLLALDNQCADLGPPWTERPLMYGELSVLNQDVAYERPATVLWTLLLHAAIGAGGSLTGGLTGRRRGGTGRHPLEVPATPSPVPRQIV